MTKNELIDAVATDAGVSKANAREVIESTFAIINQTAEAGNKVQIRGFGTFQMKHRASRTGRNPRTGEAISLPASRSLGFKAQKGG